MSETINIQLMDHRGEVIESYLTVEHIETDQGDLDWQIGISNTPIAGVRFRETDLFRALLDLRAELTIHGFTPLVQGLRKDIIVSGMSRSMGGGRKAYVIKQGVHAQDLVDIFDFAPIELISSPEDQKLYQEEWLNSPKSWQKPEYTSFTQRLTQIIKHFL